jgi:hypothetical protein
MNTFELARAAIVACREHSCTDRCPRTIQGLCRTRIALWEAQHAAAMRWNAPLVCEVPPVDSRALEKLSDPDKG